jgi:hypothetical protein
MTTARILSVLPVNTPALFYVNRPVRGVLYTVLEGGGIALITYGSLIMTNRDCSSSGAFGQFCTIGKAAGISTLVLGSAMWLAPWLHTIVKTEDYLDTYNSEISFKAKEVAFIPIIETSKERNMYGAALALRF